ncbi:MAG: starch-binding protein, partial [Oscillospiraceae bacterium]|nr:starch-binding protein [Oscillospiraceae bacterium]
MSKKITTGVIAIVLIAALLLCGVITVGAVGVTYPQSGAAGDTVYVKNAANWGKVFAYMWNNNDDKNAVWPGQEMTPIGDGVYSYKITGNWANIIFNHGNDGNKTADMVLGSNGGRIFNNSTNSWGDYAAATTPGTTVTTPNITAPIVTQAPTPGSGTVFFKNESGWSSVNAYMWNTEDDEESAWPGKAMTNIGDNIWQYNYSGNWKNIIFNKGSGGDGNQTGDLVLPGSGSIYISGSNSWDVYDTSPLIIKSFTADLASPQYKGTAIVLSASAQTQSGTAIYYKFSAKGASTTVLQDFSTNSSVIWIPSATGSYTLTLDVKDAAGNTNTRQITYSVLDDTNVAKPIIKMVTPYSGTTLKANTAANFAVTASGGKVGTNLLFYKYIVKNASGTVINTP